MHYLIPMHPHPLTLILRSQKTYEFRSYHLPDATYLWLYVTSPISSIRYILKVGSPITRSSITLPEHLTSSPPSSPFPPPPSLEIQTTLFAELESLPDAMRLKLKVYEGNGNREFNRGVRGYAFGYPVEEVWEMEEPVTLEMIRRGEGRGVRGVPRGRGRVPEEMLVGVWEEGRVRRVWKREKGGN